ncbi:MAG: hypothetical protein ACXVCY_12675 [Pseudobdellovibrionaceae bacterium]
MSKNKLFIKIVLFIISLSPSLMQASENAPYNKLILKIIAEMPNGGGYSRKAQAIISLRHNILIKKNDLVIEPMNAMPTFCSASTYLVFLKTLAQLQKEHKINLNVETLKYLLIAKTQPDGAGIWGRWNANGPGTARLFHELQLGSNFSFNDLKKAQPGDFMKIFWNDNIGADERGHSVIFTGVHESNGTRKVCFWSSNQESQSQPGGMGEKCVPTDKIHRAVFSRLEFPQRVNDAPKVLSLNSTKYVDSYLHNLLKTSSTIREMNIKIGIAEGNSI